MGWIFLTVVLALGLNYIGNRIEELTEEIKEWRKEDRK
jgi:hypothetical protein